MAWITAHEVMLLTIGLTLSETLAFAVPSTGGILKTVMSFLRLLGAKDVDGQ
jgi:hypothetical protein